MREIVLGTAGHVDHGKTSLIRALTGIETDRLKEEKQRGITIELGFAFVDLPCGHRLGIVDVPGHEKFVRNMVAGAAGIDLVAFVIAADEGIMPQTKEHFDICKLLGVRDGIIVLTKIDMVEEEWLEMVTEEVRDFFSGSFLEDAPLVQVSSVSGDGIDSFKEILDQKVKSFTFQEEFGPFRLAVDRIFSMKGFGTVITGTSLSGRTSVGDEILFYPHAKRAKIRGIQVHGSDVKMVEAGHRTAINLQGVEKEDIHRGDVAATPDSLTPSTLLDVDFHFLEGNTRDLKNRTEVRVHVGTREVFGKIILLEADKATPGSDAAAQLILKEPVSVWSGDHYVLRGFSPLITIGGGVILNSGPRKRKRTKDSDKERNKAHWRIYRHGTDEERLLLFLEESGFDGLTAEQLSTRLGIFGKKMKKFLQLPVSSGKIAVVESDRQRLISSSVQEQAVQKVLEILECYHRDNPLKGGIAKEELRSRMGNQIDAKLFAYTLNNMAKKETIILDQAEIRLSSHEVTLQVDEEKMRADILAIYTKAGLKPANLKDVIGSFNDFTEKQIRPVLDLLLLDGKLVKVSEILYFESQVINELQERLVSYLRKEGDIDAPGFKEMTGLSRKFFIPILEYFDRIKLTARVDNRRVLRKG